jgi:hypothetical protein
MTAAESPSTTSETLQALSISHTCLPRTRSRLGCHGSPLDRSHKSDELSMAAGHGGKAGEGVEAATEVVVGDGSCELNPFEGQAPHRARPMAYMRS